MQWTHAVWLGCFVRVTNSRKNESLPENALLLPYHLYSELYDVGMLFCAKHHTSHDARPEVALQLIQLNNIFEIEIYTFKKNNFLSITSFV